MPFWKLTAEFTDPDNLRIARFENSAIPACQLRAEISPQYPPIDHGIFWMILGAAIRWDENVLIKRTCSLFYDNGQVKILARTQTDFFDK